MCTVPRLSIVIPCLSENEQFENTLISVLENRPRDCEVLVTYPGAYEDPYELEGEVSFIETRPDASLLEMVHIGWAQSAGDVVHVLQCGIRVSEGWTDGILPWFDKPSIGSAAPLLVCPGTRTVAGLRHGLLGRKLVHQTPSANPVAAPSIIGPTLRAAFYRRAALEEVGGFDLVVGDRFGDVDIALTLESAGYDSICEPSSSVTACCAEPARLGFSDARRAERVFRKHVSPQENRKRIWLHGLAVFAEFLFPFPGPRRALRFLGRLAGNCEPRLPHRDRPQEIKHASPHRPAHLAHREPHTHSSSAAVRQERRRRRRVVA
jgi:hypothetical protein